MPAHVLLKWLGLFFLVLVFAGYCLFEQRNLQRSRKDSKQSAETHIATLHRTVNRRSTYILLLLLVYTLTVAAYDIRYRQVPPAAFAAPEEAQTALQFAPLPETDPVVVARPGPPQGDTALSLFEDVTVFAENNAAAEARLDRIKQYYERLFVSYFVLEKCQSAPPHALAELQQSLASTLIRLNASPDLQERIFQAADGTFTELYGNPSCDAARLSQMKSLLAGALKPSNNPQ